MKLSLCILSLALFFSACTAQPKGKKGEAQFTNALINESSPYLLQHAHNPVNWYPWKDEAFDLAKQEQKLVVISVGYAACHWCHVMEHESFEDTAVARLMNERFISIKVDREERPDVDDVYMNACQLMNRKSCGWPLNVITLPDGRPIFAGTYFPKDNWLDVLNQVSEYYEKNPQKTEEIAARVTQGIQEFDAIPIKKAPAPFESQELENAFDQMIAQQDLKLGGRRGAPKFPMPISYFYLMDHGHYYGNEKAEKAVAVTLDQMARGGIYDHVGGGFARYSTDAQWFAPHFEKMLYDNSQLVSLYSTAYRKDPRPIYKQVVKESLAFVAREMTSPEGGFYSSLDADSEGEEGKFYVWSQEELEYILKKEADLYIKAYEVKSDGNWEHGKNILHRKMSDSELAGMFSISEEEVKASLQKGNELLLAEREKRIRPGLDDKVITSWNALMLMGYVDAYRTFGEPAYLEAALKNATFIWTQCWEKDRGLTRIYKDGKASINAFLDDYALTARAFVALYQATFDEQWLRAAEELIEYARQHFYDDTSGMFFYTSDEDDPLIVRKMETSDNVIPGSNSSMAWALYETGTYLYKDEYLDLARQMLSNVKEEALESPGFYANWMRLMLKMVHPPYEVAIVGEDWQTLRAELDQNFLPQALLLGGPDEGSLELLQYKLIPGQTTIFVCQDKVCKMPVTESAEALKLLRQP